MQSFLSRSKIASNSRASGASIMPSVIWSLISNERSSKLLEPIAQSDPVDAHDLSVPNP